MRIKRKRVESRKKLSKIIILMVFVILLILGITFAISKGNDKKLPTTEKVAEKKQEKKEEEYKVSLIMVGDMLIHSSLYNEAKKNANNNGYDFKPMLTYIKDIVSNYDLAYYNQETILGGSEIGLSSYPAFNSPYEVGDDMIDTGFNLVSLATNHTLDRGIKAIENSLNYWNSKNVYTAGSYKTLEDRNNIKIAEKNNITYAMLNYTYGTNGIVRPSGYDSYVNIWDMSNKTNYENYKEQVKKDIESIRDKVDVLMVAMHWGIEYNFDINSYQEDAAKFLSSLGVDIIIGTHPHVVEPVTWIDNTLVIYSLGNFLSAHEVVNIANRVGLMTSIDITKKVNGDNKEITLSNLSNDLIYTYHNNYTNFKIIPFSNKDIYNYLDNADEIYNKYSSIVKKLDNNINVLELPA